MRPLPVVAIDGPAGSGKSTVAGLLAQRLSFTHINTGAIYRGVALLALENKLPLDNEEAIVGSARSPRLEFRQLPEGNILHIDGRNVGAAIRTEEVSAAASKVSAYPKVRALLLGLQRKLGEYGGVVLEGRDIGTVVFPDAELKIYLTANLQTRANRRKEELRAQGAEVGLDQIMAEMAQRDKQDSERAIAPLRQAADAVLVDTTGLTIEMVVDRLESLVRAHNTTSSPISRRGF